MTIQAGTGYNLISVCSGNRYVIGADGTDSTAPTDPGNVHTTIKCNNSNNDGLIVIAPTGGNNRARKLINLQQSTTDKFTAAADADTALPSGSFYTTTAGGRAIFKKP